jgi:hypothetical protein
MGEPIKLFLSYAHQDRDFAQRLSKALDTRGIATWMDVWRLKPGDNWVEKINEGLRDTDGIVVVLSKSATASRWIQAELSAYLARELSSDRQVVYPVLIEDVEIPISLRDRQFADFRGQFDPAFQNLLRAIEAHRTRKAPVRRTAELRQEQKEAAIDHQLAQIRSEYEAGNVALVCGAGVSVDSGLPSWPALLQALLSELFGQKTQDGQQEALATIFQDSFRPTPLMVAQYLKNGLGKAFLPRLRDALYSTPSRDNALTQAIVEICRPQRSRASLRSIITFNFDDVIEHHLAAAGVRHKSVFKEGQRCRAEELPVYHVHGFLPRSGRITEENMVVLSEDAYHSQFLDPFSWSNLVQLSHLSQNRCLLIGLSLTDPNLRRLLDVAGRKNPDRTPYHYVIKRRYDPRKIAKAVRAAPLKDRVSFDDLVRVAESLEEQDANNLGLNVIWVDGYEEIPGILLRLISASASAGSERSRPIKSE